MNACLRGIFHHSAQDDVSVIMILKMYFCGVKTHIQNSICVLTFQKDKRRYFATRSSISYIFN